MRTTTSIKTVLFTFAATLALIAQPLYADKTTKVFEGASAEELKQLVSRSLDKLGEEYKENDDTMGFENRLQTTGFLTPTYDIYISSYKNGSIMRVETIEGGSLALTDVIAQENGEGPFPVTHQKQDYFLGYALTLIQPSLGYYYTNLDSPMTNKYSWLIPLAWILTDGLLLYTGGTNFFQDTANFAPFTDYLTPTLILMGVHRLLHLYPVHMRISMHNQMVSLGYTFRY